jgi:hypothetical protein
LLLQARDLPITLLGGQLVSISHNAWKSLQITLSRSSLVVRGRVKITPSRVTVTGSSPQFEGAVKTLQLSLPLM